MEMFLDDDEIADAKDMDDVDVGDKLLCIVFAAITRLRGDGFFA